MNEVKYLWFNHDNMICVYRHNVSESLWNYLHMKYGKPGMNNHCVIPYSDGLNEEISIFGWYIPEPNNRSTLRVVIE